MPKLLNRPPAYRLHKASGQAVVTLDGKDHYLGPHGSKASQAKYQQLLAEFLSRGCVVDSATKSDLLIVQLLAAYRRWCLSYYRSSREMQAIGWATKPFRQLYGRTRVADFGPLKLKAFRQHLIESNLCRNEINKRIGRIKRIFKWGVENELVDPSVLHALQAVRGLTRGRSAARETEPICPVPEAFVDAIKPHVTPQIWAMIELQRLTGIPLELTVEQSLAHAKRPTCPRGIRTNSDTMRRRDFARNSDWTSPAWSWDTVRHKLPKSTPNSTLTVPSRS